MYLLSNLLITLLLLYSSWIYVCLSSLDILENSDYAFLTFPSFVVSSICMNTARALNWIKNQSNVILKCNLIVFEKLQKHTEPFSKFLYNSQTWSRSQWILFDFYLLGIICISKQEKTQSFWQKWYYENNQHILKSSTLPGIYIPREGRHHIFIRITMQDIYIF